MYIAGKMMILIKSSCYGSLQNSKRLIEGWGSAIEFSVSSTTYDITGQLPLPTSPPVTVNA